MTPKYILQNLDEMTMTKRYHIFIFKVK